MTVPDYATMTVGYKMMNQAYKNNHFLRELGGGGNNGIPPPEDPVLVLLLPDPSRSDVVLEVDVVDDLFPDRPGMLW